MRHTMFMNVNYLALMLVVFVFVYFFSKILYIIFGLSEDETLCIYIALIRHAYAVQCLVYTDLYENSKGITFREREEGGI